MKTYLVVFNSYKDGKVYRNIKKEVDAYDIYDAIEQVENYCHSNCASCEITLVKLLNGFVNQIERDTELDYE